MLGQFVPALSVLVLAKEGILARTEPEKRPALPSVRLSKRTGHSDSPPRDIPLGQSGDNAVTQG